MIKEQTKEIEYHKQVAERHAQKVETIYQHIKEIRDTLHQ